MLSLQFNQDHGCFSCCMDTGLRIYNVEPLSERAHLEASLVGSVALCEMLCRTNLLAIVGGGPCPKFADNTVLIWDDLSKRFVMELTFPAPVLAVRLRRDKVVVVTRRQVHVMAFLPRPAKLFTCDTWDNPKGLCQVSPVASCERHLLLFPGQRCGSVQILDLCTNEPGTSLCPVTINAHQSELACLALNQHGTLLATASIKVSICRAFFYLLEVSACMSYKMVNMLSDTDGCVICCLLCNGQLCEEGSSHSWCLSRNKEGLG